MNVSALQSPSPVVAADAAPLPDPEVLAVLGKARRGRRGLWIGLGLLAAGVVAAALSLGGGAPAYETAPVTRGALTQSVTAVGQLAPMRSVEVGSRLSGQVVEVTVDTNARVAAGDVLARLDPTPFALAVTQAKAQVESARAALEQARVGETSKRLVAERTARLLEKGAATAVEAEDARLALEEARAAVASAEATVALRRAALADAEEDLADTVITAPIDGVVTRRSVDDGQTVVSAMSAATLFEIASDLGALKAEVGVDEADVGRVRAGLTGTFTVSAFPDRTFPAEVVAVDLAPADDADVVTYEAELRVENPDGALRPGMTATAVLESGRVDGVLLVPAAALRWRPERAASFGPPGMAKAGGAEEAERVYVLTADGPAERVVTVLGHAGTDAAVRGELTTDDVVVVGGGAE